MQRWQLHQVTLHSTRRAGASPTLGPEEAFRGCGFTGHIQPAKWRSHPDLRSLSRLNVVNAETLSERSVKH